MTLRAHEITQEDVDGLRAYGLSDPDIIDIALTSAARSFYSKLVDALGVTPSPEWLKNNQQSLGEELLQILIVGRPLVPLAEADVPANSEQR